MLPHNVYRALGLCGLLVVACSVPSAPPVPTPTRVVPTATLSAPTSTPRPDYAGMRNALRNPLSSLIVSVRNGDAQNTSVFLSEFNTAADHVLVQLSDDTSQQATLLRTTISNVRAEPRELKVLERERDLLLFPPNP